MAADDRVPEDEPDVREETRSKIGVLRNSQDMQQTAPVGVAIAEDQTRIFGLRPNEFTGTLMVLFVFPIVIAISRWIWRRSPARPSRENVLEGSPQIARLEQAVEAIAIEVERISEAQRFSAKLLAERAVEPVSEQAASPGRARRPVITPLP